MTCIVAVTDGQTVVMGADSAGTAGYELRLRADPKVFRAGSYAIGFTTSFRMGQILRFCSELPEPPSESGPEELERFMVTEFIDAVRRDFSERGFRKTLRASLSDGAGSTEEGQEWGGLFLVGVAGQIFEIRHDYQVARPTTPYSAIGRGALIALGALHAMKNSSELKLGERVENALKAAESYCTTVRGPFHFVELRAARAALA